MKTIQVLVALTVQVEDEHNIDDNLYVNIPNLPDIEIKTFTQSNSHPVIGKVVCYETLDVDDSEDES